MYWTRHPPVHISARSIYYLLGGEPPKDPPKPRRASTASDSGDAGLDAELGSLIQMAGVQRRPFVMPVRMLDPKPEP